MLESTGWTLVQVLKNHQRSHTDGSMIDLYLYKLTREAWADWRRAHPDRARRGVRLPPPGLSEKAQ